VGVEQDKGAELRGAGTDMHLQLVNGQVIKGSRANYPPHISPLFYVHCRLPTSAELITARAYVARQLESKWNQPDGGIKAHRLLQLRQKYTTDQIQVAALKPAVAREACVANEPGVAAMLTLEEPHLKMIVEMERGLQFQGGCALVASKHQTISPHTSTAAVLHKRMGHTGWSGLRRMVGNVNGMGAVMARELTAAQQPPCEICVSTKLTAAPHPLTEQRAEKPLEKVHTDVAGPIDTVGYQGGRYFVTLVDEYSAYAAVGVLHSKEETGDWLKAKLLQWERIANKSVTTVHSDRGGEYVAGHLQRWFGEQGIVHTFTTAYSPQSNGMAERLNRTMKERVRSMLAAGPLPAKLWPAALTTAAYLHNMVPCGHPRSIRHKQTPYELFTTTVPNVSHLRAYGCPVYVRLEPHERSNSTAPVAIRGKMVGYESGGYLVWKDGGGMHRATRYVWFDEEWEVAQKISTPSLPPSLMEQKDRFWQHSPGSEPITSQISIPSPATAAGTSVQRAASQQIAQGGGGAQAAAAGSVGGGGVGREENGEGDSEEGEGGENLAAAVPAPAPLRRSSRERAAPSRPDMLAHGARHGQYDQAHLAGDFAWTNL